MNRISGREFLPYIWADQLGRKGRPRPHRFYILTNGIGTIHKIWLLTGASINILKLVWALAPVWASCHSGHARNRRLSLFRNRLAISGDPELKLTHPPESVWGKTVGKPHKLRTGTCHTTVDENEMNKIAIRGGGLARIFSRQLNRIAGGEFPPYIWADQLGR